MHPVHPHVDNSHQVWNWYDHQLPSYSVFVCWYVTWPWPWTDVIHGESRDQPCHQVWRPYAYPVVSYELERFPLVTIENAYAATAHALNHRPASRGSKTITFLECSTPICLFTMQLRFGSTMKVIKVICENNARPCVKRLEFLRMCEITWSVKGTLNALLQSFSSTSIYRTGLQK